MDFPLSKSFQFYELTQTSHATLLEQNRTEALLPQNLAPLYVLAQTVLQPLRDALGKPIRVNSGYRCPALNQAVAGSSSSQHMLGQAADLDLGSLQENKKLFDLAIKLGESSKIRFGQLILEGPSVDSAWVHISLGQPYREAEGQIMSFNGAKYTLLRTLTWKV